MTSFKMLSSIHSCTVVQEGEENVKRGGKQYPVVGIQILFRPFLESRGFGVSRRWLQFGSVYIKPRGPWSFQQGGLILRAVTAGLCIREPLRPRYRNFILQSGLCGLCIPVGTALSINMEIITVSRVMLLTTTTKDCGWICKYTLCLFVLLRPVGQFGKLSYSWLKVIRTSTHTWPWGPKIVTAHGVLVVYQWLRCQIWQRLNRTRVWFSIGSVRQWMHTVGWWDCGGSTLKHHL